MDQSYLKFWNINEPAFTKPVEADDLYFPKDLKKNLKRLREIIDQPQVLTLVTGQGGSGKSSIAKWLHRVVLFETHEVVLFSLVRKEKKSGWLVPKIAHYFGVDTDKPWQEMLQDTAERMDQLVTEGRRLLILIDAAHLLCGPQSLEEITALLNLQSLGGECLSFTLLGKEDTLVEIAQVEELRTKIGCHVRLVALDLTETETYLSH